MSRYSKAVGAPTLAVIWTKIGDPRDYGSSGAFVKALGLNLKEISSGKRKGELGISKRGPALARRWIYFWAMRSVQRVEVRKWYAEFIQVGGARSNGKEHRKMKGIVSLMRKLCKSLWHASVKNEDFDYAKVVQAETPKIGRRRRRRTTQATA